MSSRNRAEGNDDRRERGGSRGRIFQELQADVAGRKPGGRYCRADDSRNEQGSPEELGKHPALHVVVSPKSMTIDTVIRLLPKT
jgi:hypothetical protein